MAPRQGTPHECGGRGTEGVREQAAALKAAISQISGVASACVSCDPEGRVTSIDVLVEKGVQSRRVVRDVESACTAHLGRRLPSTAITVTREPAGTMRAGRKRLVPALSFDAVAAVNGSASAEGEDTATTGQRAGLHSPTPSSVAGGPTSGPDGGISSRHGNEVPTVKRYRVVSRSGAAPGRGVGREQRDSRESERRGRGGREGGDDGEPKRIPRIGMKRLGVNVYPDRIHAMVELTCGPKTFIGEEDDLANEENRFKVPAAAALKALDKAFGGLVAVSVGDIQVCRLSGRKTAVVLATIGSPWGDMPSTGASYVTRSEEEAVIRALLHAVNRCVTLSYGGEYPCDEDAV